MKKRFHEWIRKYVLTNRELQESIVKDWAGDAEITTYHVTGSEFSIENANVVNSTFQDCRIKEMTNNNLSGTTFVGNMLSAKE